MNYDAPINERIFVHRAGRTGRALRQGIILTIATKEEVYDFANFFILSTCRVNSYFPYDENFSD